MQGFWVCKIKGINAEYWICFSKPSLIYHIKYTFSYRNLRIQNIFHISLCFLSVQQAFVHHLCALFLAAFGVEIAGSEKGTRIQAVNINNHSVLV